MAGIQYAGEFTLDTCELITSSGIRVNLLGSVVQVDIFEDIYKNSISGSISIADTNNIVRDAQITGQDYIRLKITTPSLSETEENQTIDYTENVLYVYKIGTKFDISRNAQFFELSFITPETLRNQRIRLSKSFTGPNSDIVKAILKSSMFIDSRKKIHLEDSVGAKRHVAPNVHPFIFINHLMKDSVSQISKSPLYLFFENTRGFHFKTLQSMYNEETKQNFHVGDPGELDNVGSKVRDIQKEFETTITFELAQTSDMLKNIIGGVLGSKMQTIDLFNKTISTQEYKYFKDYKKHERISGKEKQNDNPVYVDGIINDFEQTIGDFSDAKLFLNSLQSDNNSNAAHYNEETAEIGEKYPYRTNDIKYTMQHRIAKMIELATTLTATMKVNGHCGMSCGQTIMITKPDANNKKSGYIDELESGKYLITKLRHIFSIPTRKHECAMVVCKDSHPLKKEQITSIVEPKANSKEVEFVGEY